MLVAAKTRCCERDWFFMNEVRSRSDGVSSHHAPTCRWTTAKITKYLPAPFVISRHLGQFRGGKRVGHAMACAHAAPSRRHARSFGSGTPGIGCNTRMKPAPPGCMEHHRPMSLWIDTHCHLDAPEFDPHPHPPPPPPPPPPPAPRPPPPRARGFGPGLPPRAWGTA